MSLCPCRPRTMATPKLPTIRVTTSVAAIHRQRRPGLGGGAGTMGAAWPSGGMGDGPCSPPPKTAKVGGRVQVFCPLVARPPPFPRALACVHGEEAGETEASWARDDCGPSFYGIGGGERGEGCPSPLHSHTTFFCWPIFLQRRAVWGFLAFIGVQHARQFVIPTARTTSDNL